MFKPKARYRLNAPLAIVAFWVVASTSPDLHGQGGRDTGFYPTLGETEMLGGESKMMYRRGVGGLNVEGPDAGNLTASGLWAPDREPHDNFYERNSGFFDPLDSTLGILVPREVLAVEDSPYTSDRGYAYVDPGFPLTRDFNPDLSHFRLGPLFVDVLSIGGTALYADYTGTPDRDDGFVSIAQVNLRGFAQLTENLYLTMSAQVYYLPGTDEWGVYFADGQGSGARLGYEKVFGDWVFNAYDQFRVNHQLSRVFSPLNEGARDDIGRYGFGRLERTGSSDYFDDRSISFSNTVGARLAGPVSGDTIASFAVDHTDIWGTSDFDRHVTRDSIQGRLDYRQDWWFAPYVQYKLTAVDYWERLYHHASVGGNARLTENLFFSASAGYFWNTSEANSIQRPTARVRLIHELGAHTNHSLELGARETFTDFGEDYFAKYVRYNINHSLGSRASLRAFARYARVDNLGDTTGEFDTYSMGSGLKLAFTDSLQGRFDAIYDIRSPGDVGVDRERWIYRAQLQQRFLPYLYGTFTYQYTDFNAESSLGYNEHLYKLSMSYLF